jgi:hypothetical protein
VKLLARVLVDLPDHWAERRVESLWARTIGGDLYEIEDVPFFAYGLNCSDVVRAVPRANGLPPVVREVVRRGGHSTLRIVFRSCADDRARQEVLLAELSSLKVSFLGWSDGFFALDVAPDGNVAALIDRLERLEKRDVLGFETCEARLAGSFAG